MKKKILLAAAIALVVALFAAGCGQKESASTSNAPSDSSGSGSGAVALTPYTFKLAHESGPQGPLQVYAEALDRHLQELSDGAYSLQIFTAGQLGDAMACVEQCQAGTLDMVIGGYGNFSSMVGGYVGALGLPYVLPSNISDVNTMVQESEGVAMLAEAVRAKKIEVLSWPCEGADWWSANKPIHTPDDMKGQKFRVIMSAVGLATFEAYGANCTPIPYTDLYSSLQLKVVEGQCNPLTSIRDMKFYEVQDYLIDCGSSYLIHCFGMNLDLWNSLPAEGQEIIHEAVRLAEEDYYPYLYESEAELEDFFVGEGLTIIHLTDEEKAAFREKVKSVPEVFAEECEDPAYAKQIVDQIIQDAEKYN